MKRALPLLATCLAFHPVLRWTALRAVDGSDEPWNLLALAAVPLCVWFARRPPARISLALPLVLVAVYALTYPLFTPLPRGMLAMSALAALVSPLWLGTRFHVALWLLLLLGLPIMASLEFFVGYPLRVCVATAAALLLRLSGFAVEVQGVALMLGERAVLVDAPCSGLKMLWVGGFATALLAFVRGLSAWSTLRYAACAFMLLLGANVVRAAALFPAELGLVKLPAWGHDGVGLVMFAVTLVALALLVHRVSQAERRHG